MKEALFKPEMGILWQVMAKFETKYVFDILILYSDKWEKCHVRGFNSTRNGGF